tara:strand:+ start:4965 stop:6752 length:1788 start_codon:yes stop_codon:yes gene_type:complete
MQSILGINAYHADSSAAIIVDGKIIAAAENERFTRVKHSAGFPNDAIKWCLNKCQLSLKDLDHIAINTLPKSNINKKILYTLLNTPSPGFIIEKIKKKAQRFDLDSNINLIFPGEDFNGEYHFVEHHLCHMASAFFASEYNESSVLSVDGFGDFSSCAWGYGNDFNLKADGYIHFPHSLGILYTAITQYLGFPNYGDEYKVMGLAPYGMPRYLDKIRRLVSITKDGLFKLNLKYFNHGKQNLNYQWEGEYPVLDKHFSYKLIDLLGPEREKDEEISQRHFDIASSLQFIYEEAFFNLLNKVYYNYDSKSICLAGGCAANSVANGKISKFTNFKRVYIQSAAGDAGGALGAALYVSNNINSKRTSPMASAYLGPSFTNKEIETLLESSDIKNKLKKIDCKINKIGDNELKDIDQYIKEIVNYIEEGKVVGWFNGAMEWGPRALGNRSIICDPRRSDIQSILNKKIKKRESFRPFAPSIMKEHAKEWFDIPDDFELNVPYMMQVLPFKENKRDLVPAVCHVDGTGRLQTVTSALNERYYSLIKEFFQRTNIPMLLNTSFNENEPIVCTPLEAFNCFSRTKMDMLVLNDFIIKRLNND